MGLIERLRAARRVFAGVSERSRWTADDATRLVDEGVAFEQTGRLEDAMQCYDKALRLEPSLARAHLCRGNILLESSNLDGAVKAYSTALSHNPNYAPAHYNLGNVHFRANRHEAAAVAYQTAITLKPDFADAEVALGVLLENMGQPTEAVARYRRALEIKPDYMEVYSNLGEALKGLGRPEEAAASYRHALEIDPDFVMTYFHLCAILEQLGHKEDAMATYRHLLTIKPELVEAHNNLGNLLKNRGRHDEAIASYREALKISPDAADVLNNLGSIMEETGRPDDAVLYYRHALEVTPNAANVHSNLGNALQALALHEEALTHYRKALEIGPNLADVHGNIGNALHRLGRFDEALESYRIALTIDPRHAGVHSNIGTTLKDLDRLPEALASFRAALEIDPNYRIAFHNLLFVLNYDPDKSAKEIYESYREYERRFAEPHRSNWPHHENSEHLNRRLKVGYVSPDFKGHACSFFIEPLLAHHDRGAVDVYAYADLVKEDATTARLKSYVEHWVPTLAMSDMALAQRIRSDGIDILVDLAGHTSGNRLGVFARKPAPVSLSWLGFGYTTGLTAIDYYLTDAVSAPEGCESLFSEVPWRLKDTSFVVYRPGHGMGEVSSLPALGRGYLTLGTLTRSVRINRHTIRLWAKLLKRLPTAQIVIDSSSFKDLLVQEATIKRFEAHGIERARLLIGCHSPPWDVLRGIDIGLDCFPHNSGTTLFESLYMGVPYVTLAGRPSVGRIGSAILHGLGRTEWIAVNEEEYLEKVVALASDLPALAGLRTRLRAEMQASALMDEVGFTRKVEQAYKQMFQTWIASQR